MLNEGEDIVKVLLDRVKEWKVMTSGDKPVLAFCDNHSPHHDTQPSNHFKMNILWYVSCHMVLQAGTALWPDYIPTIVRNHANMLRPLHIGLPLGPYYVG